jgi:hypothetical protein
MNPILILMLAVAQPPTGNAVGSKGLAESVANAMAAGNSAATMARAVELKAKSMGPVKLPEAHSLWKKRESGDKLNPIESARLKLFAPTPADATTARETIDKIKGAEINPARVKAMTKGREKMATTKTGFLFADAETRDKAAEQAAEFSKWVESLIEKK